MTLRESLILNKLDELINPATEETVLEILAALNSVFPNESIIEFGVLNTVASDSQVTLVTYTNTTGQDIWFDGIMATGNVDACFSVFIDGAQKMEIRTSPVERTAKISFGKPIKIADDSVMQIKVIHFHTATADFSGTIFGSKYDV